MRRQTRQETGQLEGLFLPIGVLAILVILLWILFWNSGDGFPHFAYWDFWCAPVRDGPSVANLFAAITSLGAAWLVAAALSVPHPTIARLAGETAFLLLLLVTLHVLDHWLGAPYCRIAAEREMALGVLKTLDERWLPPPGYRAVRCLADGQHHCWRRQGLAPYAPSTAFPMISPARTVAARRAACAEGVRLAYRPHLVKIASAPAPRAEAESGFVSYCLKKLRVAELPANVTLIEATTSWPKPDPYPEGWGMFGDVRSPADYACRFARDGTLLSAARLTTCDQLAP